MKRILILFMFLFLLAGCNDDTDILLSEVMDDVPEIKYAVSENDIWIYKNIALELDGVDQSQCYESAYQPVVLKESYLKEDLIEIINGWKYLEKDRSYLSECGYKYVVQWNELHDSGINIDQINIGIFENNGKLYVQHSNEFYLLRGSIDFFENLEFSEKVE